MTRSADAPAHEPVYKILRNAARPGLELRPETLRSRAALLFERIYNSFILLQKIKEPHRRRIALYTANTLYAEHAGARRGEPDLPPDTCRFRVPLVRASFAARARALWCTAVYGYAMVPADLGWALAFDQSTRKVGNSFTSNRGQRRAIQQRRHSASHRLPASVRQEPGSMGNDYRIPPSERHRERPEPWFWYDTIASLSTRQFPSARRGGRR